MTDSQPPIPLTEEIHGEYQRRIQRLERQIPGVWSELRSACANGDAATVAQVIAAHANLHDGDVFMPMMIYARDVLGYAPVTHWVVKPSDGDAPGQCLSLWNLVCDKALQWGKHQPTIFVMGTIMSVDRLTQKEVCFGVLDWQAIISIMTRWRYRVADMICDWLGGEDKETWRAGLHEFLATWMHEFNVNAAPPSNVRENGAYIDEGPPRILQALNGREVSAGTVCYEFLRTHDKIPASALYLLMIAPQLLNLDQIQDKAIRLPSSIRGDVKSTLGHIVSQPYPEYLHREYAIGRRIYDELNTLSVEALRPKLSWVDGLEPRRR